MDPDTANAPPARAERPAPTRRDGAGAGRAAAKGAAPAAGAFGLFAPRGATSAPRGSGVLDLLIVLVSFAVVHRLWLGHLDFIAERLFVLLATVVSVSASFALGGLYRRDRARALHEEVGRLVVCWTLSLAAIGLFAFLSKTGEDVSRVWVGTSMLVALAALVLQRCAHEAFVRSSRPGPDEALEVVVVGSGETAERALERLDANRWSGYRAAAVFGDPRRVPGSLPGARSVAGPAEEVLDYVETRRRAGAPIDEVWIALGSEEQGLIRTLCERLRDSSVDVCVVPDAFGMQLLSGTINRVAELPVVNVSDIRLPSNAEWFKNVFDKCVAGSALVLLAPLMGAVALAVRLESPGPAIFRQRRYGIDGREIEVWKFRSMRVQENGDAVRQAVRGDDRVTRVGRFIRRTSIDELPQLFNVLRGDMSIVGPRPHAVVHNEQYRHRIAGYMMRHKIRPGITGWAQVNGWRGETDTLEKMEKRVQFDLEYIRHWSPWLDLKIVLLTVARGMSGRDVY